MNKFFSLPDVLISKIYEYDNTYRIFGTSQFKNDLRQNWIKYKIKRCKYEILNYMECLIEDECIWMNEYGYIGDKSEFNKKLIKNLIQYKSVNDFEIYTHPVKDEIMYFKIYPKGSSILKYSSKFDGFLCHSNKDDYFQDNFSEIDFMDTYGEISHIHTGGMDGPFVISGGNHIVEYFYESHPHSDICLWM